MSGFKAVSVQEDGTLVVHTRFYADVTDMVVVKELDKPEKVFLRVDTVEDQRGNYKDV